jgi:hypothetical protein
MGQWDTYQFQHTMGDGWVCWSQDNGNNRNRSGMTSIRTQEWDLNIYVSNLDALCLDQYLSSIVFVFLDHDHIGQFTFLKRTHFALWFDFYMAFFVWLEV